MQYMYMRFKSFISLEIDSLRSNTRMQNIQHVHGISFSLSEDGRHNPLSLHM